jgi:hypothetical protein
MGLNLAFLLSVLPALTGLAAVQAAGDFAQVQRVVIEQQEIIRVPVRPQARQQMIRWIEQPRGPACIRQRFIAGALITGPNQVDFVMRTNRRFRARLEANCPGLNFYSGFYLNPQDDKICAGRDEIYSRIGGSCPIGEFHALAPVRRQAQ